MNNLVVLDLDGTLLKNDKTVSNFTIDTLIQLKKSGNKILFATARPPRDAYKYVPEMLRDNPIICYNGACILEGKKIIYRKEMSKKDTLNIINVAKKFKYDQICFEINDTLYSNFDTSDFFGKAPTQIVDLSNLDFETAYKVIICSKETINDDFMRQLPNSCKSIITDNGTLCQIMNQESSKWSSIKYLSEILKIDAKNIIAFGDDYNDLDMIKNACIGVAMGNAEDVIKDIADFVTDTNMNDGIAKYIKKYIL